MPFTYNGIGTKYYGKRDQGEDGSYITTEWITLVYLPLIPIGSFRVKPTGGGTNRIIYRSEQFLVKRIGFNWPQIRNTYGVVGGILAGITAIGVAITYMDSRQASDQMRPGTTQIAQLPEQV